MTEKKLKKNIIAYVSSIPAGAVESIRAYGKREKRKFRVMLIADSKGKHKKTKADHPSVDIFLEVDFKKSNKIAEALLPYQDELLAITCRSDSNIMKFALVIPHVPYLRTPTTESLKWATDKLEMRRRFSLLAKRYSPKYAVVRNNTKAERKRIADKIGFPLVVKPANLASSMLVTICYHEEELEKTLRNVFKKIKKTYGDNGRTEEPKILAEEYMEGSLYSVDAYVNSRGTVYFCPMVKVTTGRDVGHDDFYLYLQMTPTGLKKTSVEKAHEAAQAGIHALGLRNTTAHVELMRVDDDWKLVEIGPRIGGFRPKLHQLSCDIEHSLNDVFIHMPKKPVVPKKCKGVAAVLKWYPEKEGKIIRLKGIKKIRELKSLVEITVNKKIGDRCHYAKNGGKPVFVVTLYNNERSKLLADIRRIEKLVDIQIK